MEEKDLKKNTSDLDYNACCNLVADILYNAYADLVKSEVILLTYNVNDIKKWSKIIDEYDYYMSGKKYYIRLVKKGKQIKSRLAINKVNNYLQNKDKPPKKPSSEITSIVKSYNNAISTKNRIRAFYKGSLFPIYCSQRVNGIEIYNQALDEAKKIVANKYTKII